MRTEFPSKHEIVRAWHVIDASDAVLGRVASRAAMLLMGKHKPTYAPSIDTGDHVIIVNAAKVKLTGGKEDQKLYRRHTGYPGGLIETGARKMRADASAANDRTGDFGHAAEDEARQADVPEAEGLRGRSASASGAEAVALVSVCSVEYEGKED